jgi:acyl-CoA synthetase (AMP-forming)/AMP-acid ligase II
VLEASFDPERVLQLIDAGLVTGIMGVPTIYQRLAEHPIFDSTDMSSLRWCVCGGAPLSVSLIRKYHERDVPFTQGYGLTEAAPNCLFLPPEDSIAKAGAAGLPYFFVDVEVHDDEDEPVGAGGRGEIVVRGPSVMKGYWRRPEQTADALRGGWLRTGDVGLVDEDGYIFVVDRVKDMYISGGENVYPAEIEKVLCEHPGVAEAAVIGISDERWGEAGRAVIVLRAGSAPDEAGLSAWLAERLAKFKIPTSFVFADSLPRNATGKLLKPELREMYGETR